MVRQSCLAVAVIAVLALTTGAAAGPDASRAELMAYSIGSLIAIVTVIRIVIKLFWYILQALATAAVLLTVYVVVIRTIHAVQALLGT
ncbi:hypothetical protein [Actinoplanes sp. NPDC051411]|uniref:hypothetical protein n=1 Tax=Actinoplanes sp. NPDC051411 TaxID=3155522 RepID=UPI003424946C